MHAGAFPCGLALQGAWCWRNVLPAQPETCGLLQPEKLGGLWQLWLLGPGSGLCHGGCFPGGLDSGGPGPEWWPCMLCGWAGRSMPQERGTLGEGTVGKLEFISWYLLLMSVPPRLATATEQAGQLVMGKLVFISTPWCLRVLSPPSYVQLLGTALSGEADLAPEPPAPLSVWHQEVCAAACPFLQPPIGQRGSSLWPGKQCCCFKAI